MPLYFLYRIVRTNSIYRQHLHFSKELISNDKFKSMMIEYIYKIILCFNYLHKDTAYTMIISYI